MKFGVYDHIDKSGAPLSQFYEDRLRLAEAYDRLGYRALHTAEHHATPLGMSPAASVFHSAVAQRTKRLRFGPLVYTLNLYHPLRLYEEICQLDQMGNGRLEMGVGRGISPFELRYFGADPELGQPMYVEAFEVLMKAFANDTLDHQGRFYQFKEVPLELKPKQQPHPPIWYGIGNPESIPWCVSHKVNLVANGAAEMVRKITDGYRASWAAAGHAEQDLPCMGSTRHMVLAPTDAEAMQIAKRGYLRWASSYLHLFKKNNAQPRFSMYTEDFEAAHKAGLIFAGTPDTVLRQVRQMEQETGLNYLLCRFAFGDLSFEESLRSTELFAREVMPAMNEHSNDAVALA